MSEQLDFTLPDEVSRRSHPREGRKFHALLLLVLLAVVGFGVAGLLRKGGVPRREGFDPESERALAAKLQDRGLNDIAAEAWLRYLAVARLDPKERATRYYDVGKLYQEKGDFEQALLNYYRSEAIAPVDEIRLELVRRKMECFRRLGNIAGFHQELEAMTSLGGKEAKEPGAEVVAEIGPEKITMADVNQGIDRMVDLQLQQLSRFVSGEELNRRKEQLVDQFQSKEAKFRFLQDMVAKEVLLREAMKRGLHKERDSERAMEELRRSFLANKILDEETRDKINITESDLRDYYNSHTQEFKEPARVTISQIVTEREEDAEKILQELKEGKSFEECAKEFSVDDATREKGGEVEEEIEKGGYIPGIGMNVDVHSHLFALKENEVSSKPVEVEGKFYLFKVRKVVPETVRPFEEVRSEVERRKTQEKVQEVREALIQRLEGEHNVIIHRSKFLPEEAEVEGSPTEERKEGAGGSSPGTI